MVRYMIDKVALDLVTVIGHGKRSAVCARVGLPDVEMAVYRRGFQGSAKFQDLERSNREERPL